MNMNIISILLIGLLIGLWIQVTISDAEANRIMAHEQWKASQEERVDCQNAIKEYRLKYPKASLLEALTMTGKRIDWNSRMGRQPGTIYHPDYETIDHERLPDLDEDPKNAPPSLKYVDEYLAGESR